MNWLQIRGSAVGVAAGMSLVLAGVPAAAHHSVALQYDMSSEVTVVGAIVELEWRNPHAWLHLEVENEAGVVQLWKIEFSSANSLYRRGWRPDNLVPGIIRQKPGDRKGDRQHHHGPWSPGAGWFAFNR